MTRRNRLLAAVTVAVALALILLATQLGDDNNGPEDVALAYLRAEDANDYGAVWDNASSIEREGRTRDQYIEHRESLCGNPCTPPPTRPDDPYEVAYTREDGQWVRVGVRTTRPDRPQPYDDEVILVEQDGRWGVVAVGPEGYDPDETP